VETGAALRRKAPEKPCFLSVKIPRDDDFTKRNGGFAFFNFFMDSPHVHFSYLCRVYTTINANINNL